MKVKINDTWYDSKKVPICLHMHPIEKDQISTMTQEKAPEFKYAIVPDEWSNEYTLEWMEVQKEEI